MVFCSPRDSKKYLQEQSSLSQHKNLVLLLVLLNPKNIYSVLKKNCFVLHLILLIEISIKRKFESESEIPSLQ